ncbi:MerR family transcriptional regulator [Ornithinimicrobium sp. LYQ92]|uniref:MerR family transcriptional regulator n=1 Tax=Serinicoccus sp. LYQ92 TaxID=3378798 RepID=UPI0038548229
MRSNDLARLAGISVRTLRHYHQVGVLEEPVRSGNGYRDYDTHALVRVLRIRRLAELGFSLAQIATLVEGSGPAAEDLFDSLDAEFAEQIERLTRQRELLAHLRRHGVPPDLPPEIAASHELLRRSGLTESAAELDRDYALLLAQVLGAAGQEYLTAVYDLMSRPARAPATAAAMAAWADLDDESTEADIDRLVGQLTELLVPVLAELTRDGGPPPPSLAEAQLQEHTTDYVTLAQQRLLERLLVALEKEQPDP